MAADFETFQLAFNKLHQATVELQEANRDVLLGKRTTNCLSCGKGGEGPNHQVMGKDGRVYKGTPAEIARAFNENESILANTNAATAYMMYEGHSPLNNTGYTAHTNGGNNHLMLNPNASEMILQN